MNAAPLLAAAPSIEDTTSALPAILLVIGVAVVLFVLVKWVKKRLRDAETLPPVGFTLGDLRRLVKEGKMTPEEFDRAKANVLESAKRATQVKPAQEITSPKSLRAADREQG